MNQGDNQYKKISNKSEQTAAAAGGMYIIINFIT